MKTEVIMKREMLGMQIRQKHKTEFFNLKDLERLGNKHRIEKGLNVLLCKDYFRSPVSKQFINELEKEYGKVQIGGRGRGNEKWVHPYLFIDIALWFSPELKVKIYKWIYDNLTIFRDNSGESFKSMVNALNNNYELGGKVSVVIPKIAREIYNICGVYGSNKWEQATEEQLKLRDKIQTSIMALSYTKRPIEEIIKLTKQSLGIKND